jgi:hypothetical protein
MALMVLLPSTMMSDEPVAVVDEGTEGAMNFVPKRRLLLPTPTWQKDKAYSDFFADGVAASRKVHSRSRKDAIDKVKGRPSLDVMVLLYVIWMHRTYPFIS